MANTAPVIPVSEKTWWDLADRSITIAMLAFAVYFVVKRLMRIETEKDSLMKAQVSDLRTDIASLKTHVADCEKDRNNLYREILELKNERKV